MLRENYRKSSLGQQMLAVAGCMLGGALVIVMGFLGEFGGYESLANSGYGLVTIPFYILVVLCGVGILLRIPYAVMAAIALCCVEMIVFLCECFLVKTTDVNFLFLVKIAVILSCTQLMVKIGENEEDIEEYVAQKPMMVQQRGRRPGVTNSDIENAAAHQGCALPRQQRGFANAPQPKRLPQQAPMMMQRRMPVGYNKAAAYRNMNMNGVNRQQGNNAVYNNAAGNNMRVPPQGRR